MSMIVSCSCYEEMGLMDPFIFDGRTTTGETHASKTRRQEMAQEERATRSEDEKSTGAGQREREEGKRPGREREGVGE